MTGEIKSKRLAINVHEKELVSKMISIYCKKNHKTSLALCKECEELDNYARKRIDNCPFSDTKTFCSSCTVHCYSPQMRDRIRQVMRFSGPRIIFYYPKDVISHLVDTIKSFKLLGVKK